MPETITLGEAETDRVLDAIEILLDAIIERRGRREPPQLRVVRIDDASRDATDPEKSR